MVFRFDEDFFEEDIQVGIEDFVNISLHSLNQKEVITRCKFENDNFILPTYGLEHSVIENFDDCHLNIFYSNSRIQIQMSSLSLIFELHGNKFMVL